VPRWRKSTWFIFVINLLFLVAMIVAVTSGYPCTSLTEESCEVLMTQGLGFLWVVSDLILVTIWLLTSPRRR
jgi:hypothetical protein